MMLSGKPDLGSAMLMSMNSARIKSGMETASEELSTGKKVNLHEATGGDLGKLFAIEQSLQRLAVEKESNLLAAGKASVTQITLGVVHDKLVDFGPKLLSAVERGDSQTSRLIANDARHALDTVVSALNVRYGRHSVFAGAAVSQKAISSATDIVDDVSVLVSAAADSNAALQAIDSYFFDAGAGFEANIFLGSAENAPPLRNGDGTTVEYAQRADSLGIRKTFRALAIAVVGSAAPNFLGTTDQANLFREAGNAAIEATGEVIVLREKLGFAEGHIEMTSARSSAMTHAFELERASIVSADPYEAATKFEALQGQLQTIYAVTSRLSNLSLTNFLR